MANYIAKKISPTFYEIRAKEDGQVLAKAVCRRGEWKLQGYGCGYFGSVLNHVLFSERHQPEATDLMQVLAAWRKAYDAYIEALGVGQAHAGGNLRHPNTAAEMAIAQIG